MKTIKKLLAFMPLLLLSSTLFAPIINPGSKLGPVIPITYPPDLQDIPIISQKNANGTVSTTYRTSGTSITCDQPDLIFSTNTILNTLTFPKGIPSVTLPVIETGSAYYFDNINVQDPSISIDEFIQSFTNEYYQGIGRNEATIIEGKYDIKPIIINSLTMADGTNVTLAVEGGIVSYISLSRRISGQQKDLETWRIPTYLNRDNPTWINPNPEYKVAGNFVPIIKQGRQQATQEKLNVAKIKGITITLEAQQKALNTIQRLQGINNIHLPINDRKLIWNAVNDAIINNNNQPIPGEFFLNFTSEELTALTDIISKGGTYLPSSKAAIDATLKTAITERYRRFLQEILASKIDSGFLSDEGIDWYLTIPENERILISYEFNIAVEGLNEDPDKLTSLERITMINCLQEILSIATDSAHIADLNKKLDALNQPQDPVKFAAYLQEKVKSLSAPDKREAFIDWVAALTQEEKKDIDLDIQAIFVQQAFDDMKNDSAAALARWQSDNFNITELLTAKLNHKDFLLSSDATKNAILQKLNIGSDEGQKRVNALIGVLDMVIVGEFGAEKLSTEHQLALLDKYSIDIYQKAFKTLSFETQQSIAKGLDLLMNAPDELIIYQKELLPERIAAARTTADLDTIKADMKFANIPDSAMPADFTTKYDTLRTEQNKRIAEGSPSVKNAGSTGGIINLDPVVINALTGQTETIHNQIDPTTGKVTPVLVPTEDIPTKKFNDKDLEAAQEEVLKQNEERQKADEARAKANEEAAAKDESHRKLPFPFE